MKKNHHRLSIAVLSILTSILFMQTSFAEDAANNVKLPEKCPSAEGIMSTGFNYFFYSPNGLWAASYLKYRYDTDHEWTFIMSGEGEIVNSEQEARQKANDELETLVLTGGPYYRVNGDTLCIYETDNLKRVLTITPPVNVNLFSLLQ